MAVQADGGLFGYAHAIIDAFHVSRGLALDVPMGLVDFLEVLQFSMIDTEFLYDFWNLGFRLAPVAGSDFPYINLPGTERSYIRIDGPFSPQAWFGGLRQGRTFVTNGPMLSLDVAGSTIGDTLAAAKGETLNITGPRAGQPRYRQPGPGRTGHPWRRSGNSGIGGGQREPGTEPPPDGRRELLGRPARLREKTAAWPTAPLST